MFHSVCFVPYFHSGLNYRGKTISVLSFLALNQYSFSALWTGSTFLIILSAIILVSPRSDMHLFGISFTIFDPFFLAPFRTDFNDTDECNTNFSDSSKSRFFLFLFCETNPQSFFVLSVHLSAKQLFFNYDIDLWPKEKLLVTLSTSTFLPLTFSAANQQRGDNFVFCLL